jgi:hypothetical protein
VWFLPVLSKGLSAGNDLKVFCNEDKAWSLPTFMFFCRLPEVTVAPVRGRELSEILSLFIWSKLKVVALVFCDKSLT